MPRGKRATPARAPRVHATLSQTIAIYERLKDVFDKEKRAYKPGYSDARLAEQIKCASRSVVRVRVGLFGQIDKRAQNGITPEALRTDIDTIMDYLTDNTSFSEWLNQRNSKRNSANE